MGIGQRSLISSWSGICYILFGASLGPEILTIKRQWETLVENGQEVSGGANPLPQMHLQKNIKYREVFVVFEYLFGEYVRPGQKVGVLNRLVLYPLGTSNCTIMVLLCRKLFKTSSKRKHDKGRDSPSRP